MNIELTSINYNTDKSKEYLLNYSKYFNPIVNNGIKLLELGVFKGDSLLLWKDYFQKGVIVGLDSEEIHIDDPSGRIHLYKGYQQDTKFLSQVANEIAPGGFDIIIDDASHIGEFTYISFWHLFNKHLKTGGIYVIEDWRTGYWNKWIDGKQYTPPSTKKYFMKKHLNIIIDQLINYIKAENNTNTILSKCLIKLQKYTYKRKFPSHDFGMVGFIKELIDELGMDMITNPLRGGILPQRYPKFLKMEIFPGQVFIVKNLDK